MSYNNTIFSIFVYFPAYHNNEFHFRMRDIKSSYNHVKNIRTKAKTILNDLARRDLIDDQIEMEILSAKSLDALDHLVKKIQSSARMINFQMLDFIIFCICFSMHHLKRQANHRCMSVPSYLVWKRSPKLCYNRKGVPSLLQI